jgi:hypothetical protein
MAYFRMIGLGLLFLFLVALQDRLWSQTTTSTPSAPYITNVTQWGTTAITAATALTDAQANPTAPHIASYGLLWNVATWERNAAARLAVFPAASTLTGRNTLGTSLSEKSSRWSVFHNPAVSTQATISIAAEAAVRHVADCVSFAAGSTTAPALTALTVQLRDGATGAGTVLQQWQVVIPNATGQNVAPFSVCGLNLVGTTNTAMTLEFSALLTNLLQSVGLTGYNVN